MRVLVDLSWCKDIDIIHGDFLEINPTDPLFSEVCRLFIETFIWSLLLWILLRLFFRGILSLHSRFKNWPWKKTERLVSYSPNSQRMKSMAMLTFLLFSCQCLRWKEENHKGIKELTWGRTDVYLSSHVLLGQLLKSSSLFRSTPFSWTLRVLALELPQRGLIICSHPTSEVHKPH